MFQNYPEMYWTFELQYSKLKSITHIYLDVASEHLVEPAVELGQLMKVCQELYVGVSLPSDVALQLNLMTKYRIRFLGILKQMILNYQNEFIKRMN